MEVRACPPCRGTEWPAEGPRDYRALYQCPLCRVIWNWEQEGGHSASHPPPPTADSPYCPTCGRRIRVPL